MELEGNNGGDVLEIKSVSDGRISLRVGHCCTWTVNHIVPVEFITAALSKAVMDAGGVSEVIEQSGWPKDYIKSLVSLVEKI